MNYIVDMSDLYIQWDVLHIKLEELCVHESNNLSYSKLSKLPFKTNYIKKLTKKSIFLCNR